MFVDIETVGVDLRGDDIRVEGGSGSKVRWPIADGGETVPTMRYRYFICDVFTESRFGGNQLAVLPRAQGLSPEQMQQIAREFNFSESTFVLPPQAGHTRRVRIFTPTVEVPFAGHPNIGTAFVLATIGELGASTTVTFEEAAGPVPVTIHGRSGASIWCELTAPERISLGKTVPVQLLSSAVSLATGDFLTQTHRPQVGSVGLPFVIAELANRDALARARVNLERLDAIAAEGITPDIHLYTRSADAFDIRARMFAPLDGVAEDPATGSANCALAGMLAHCDESSDGMFKWRIAQGVEMGRPSVLEARAEKHNGIVTSTWIGGNCVMVSEGFIEVG